jgi:hypothetical protein
MCFSGHIYLLTVKPALVISSIKLQSLTNVIEVGTKAGLTVA